MKRAFLWGLAILMGNTAWAQTDIFVNNIFEDTRFDMNGDYRWTDGVTTSAGCFTTAHDHNGADYDLKTVYWDDDNSTPHWQTTYDGGENDYGVLTLHDATNGYFYAIGTTEDPASKFDLLVVQYNSAGVQQWAQTWDGGEEYDDVPVDAVLNGSDLYITGVANHGQYEVTDDDLFVMKMSSTGAITWSNVYDYTGYNENPVAMTLTNNYLFVVGSGYANSTTRDIVLQRFSFTSSTPTTTRISTSGNLDYATDIAFDPETTGDIYFTGRKGDDAVLYKYKDDMTEYWNYTFDYVGNMDRAMGVVVLDQKVMMANECINGNHTIAMAMCEVDKTDGTLIQLGYFEPHTEAGKRQFLNFENNGDNEPIMTLLDQEEGEIAHTGLVFFNDDAQPIGYFKAEHSTKEYLGNHALKQGKYVYLLGTTDNEGAHESLTITTETAQLDKKVGKLVFHPTSDTTVAGDTVPTDTNHFTIIFKKDAVKKSFLDDTKLEFGTIDEVLKDTISDTLESRLAYVSDAFFRKFDRWRITGDTLDTNKMGSPYIKRDVAYSLDLVFSGDEHFMELWKEMSDLPFVKTVVPRSKPNLHGSGAPNDPKYKDGQFSLNHITNSTYWNSAFNLGGINLEPVWKNYHYGRRSVRVAVSEDKVFWPHEDFTVNKAAGTSIVSGGSWFDRDWDPGYFTDGCKKVGGDGKPTPWECTGHATRVAGVIGARRNNSTGVAGIAGGNISPNGVSIYTYDFSTESDDIVEDMVSDGVHIVNQSFGYRSIMSSRLHHYSDLLKEGVIMVTSSGNSEWYDATDVPHPNAFEFPAIYFPEQTICVGGFGNNGKVWKPHNSLGVGRDKHWSKYGAHVDFLAPAWKSDYDLNYGNVSEHFVGSLTTNFKKETTLNSYSTSYATSGATPHVSGLAALLLSAHWDTYNNRSRLTPEDVERLIGMGCTDLVAADESDLTLNADFRAANYTPSNPHSDYRPMPEDGYDIISGWGRVDAEKAAYYAGDPSKTSPDFIVKHYKSSGTQMGAPTFSDAKVNTTGLVEVQMGEEASIIRTQLTTHKVDIYKLSITVSVPVPSGYKLFAPSWFKKDGVHQGGIWQMTQESNLAQPLFEQPDEYFKGTKFIDAFSFLQEDMPYLNVSSVDVANKKVTLYGYLYNIKQEHNGTSWVTVDKWYPFDPADAATEAEYGVSAHYVKTTVNIEEPVDLSLAVRVYPNPGHDLVKVFLSAYNDKTAQLMVMDLKGRVLMQEQMEPLETGKFMKELNTETLEPGVYYFQWTTGSGRVITEKFVKL